MRATLGVALAMAGRTGTGLDQLQLAVVTATDPTVMAKILVRRGHVRYFIHRRPTEALADLERALPGLRAADEHVWEARALNLVGLSALALGRAEHAARAVESAERIFVQEGQAVEAVVTLHNRGFIAYCSGDLPSALRLYDAAAEGYANLGEDTSRLFIDQCEALLAVGLAHEAVALANLCVANGSLPAAVEAELLLSLSMAELAEDDPAAAAVSATRARQLFRRQQREWWVLRSELAALLARREGGAGGRRLAEEADRVGSALAERGSEEAAVAWLLAGRVAAAAGLDTASELLERAAAFRHRPSALVRATGWHARALERDLRDDSRGVLGACRRGLDALDQYISILGSSELRALATRHGDDLARLALRRATRSRPRRMLEWTERWRANSLSQPPVHPPDDAELARDLAALRDTRRRLAEARAEGAPSAARLDDDRARLEEAIRRRTHHLAGYVDRVGTVRGRAAARLPRRDHVRGAGRCRPGAARPRRLRGTGPARRGRRHGGGRAVRRVRAFRPAPDRPGATLRHRRGGPSAPGDAARGRSTPPRRRARGGLPARSAARDALVAPARAGRRTRERRPLGRPVATSAGFSSADRRAGADSRTRSGVRRRGARRTRSPSHGGGPAAGRGCHGRAEPRSAGRRWGRARRGAREVPRRQPDVLLARPR